MSCRMAHAFMEWRRQARRCIRWQTGRDEGRAVAGMTAEQVSYPVTTSRNGETVRMNLWAGCVTSASLRASQRGWKR
ncbi:hypothetical protein KCP78_04785 [Salmonella enterica subsp. enterica]|nr:hypothetical protein KCP78_04785 [Salmonella enterica subsp. enterica]